MRFVIGFPIVLSVVGFVLAILALFAGERRGFLEEYHIIMLNTSALGHTKLLPTPAGDNKPTTTTTTGGHGIGGFFSKVAHSATAAAGAVESELAKLGDKFADKLADEIGIHEFYSLHVMNACEGEFAPNATAPGAGYNVTNCTEPMNAGQMNVSALLDQQLSVGPLGLSLSDLGVTRDLQHELNKIPGLLRAIAVLYILGAGLAGLSMLASAAGLFAYARHPRSTSLANAGLGALAALLLLVANLVTTVGGSKAAGAINKYGDGIGLRASSGGKFVAITWAAFAAMCLAAAYWTYELFMARKARRSGRGGASRRFGEKQRYSSEENPRR
ncbi:uncharacterized protein E0L32_011377 [Thyridium curvatum]|uniref:SUR7 protein n=1 Tax=Thyridium curvatum TaxID=1093900 RepID=A0A507BN03_9PEZI|nr:uncharacterized protein E0L32_011377 [Thyridium curvatum]TPX18899.1 hypothetical protein E0L32_011377 [Thyridium curvatum]